MRILFISSTRLGDAVLSTGLLAHLYKTYPDAKVTVAAGKLGLGLFEQFPNVDRVIPIVKKKYNGHWFDLWTKTVTTKWDIVVDLRSSIIPYTVWAGKRFVWNKKGKAGYHKVEQMGLVMELMPPPAPKLYFKDEMKHKAQSMLPQGEFVLAIGPTANWIGKTWYTERFIELLQRLRTTDTKFKNCTVAVFAAPGEEHLAQPVLESIEVDRRINFIGNTSPELAAALINECQFYIGNDSGLMHCACASKVPTVGLFGPTSIETYAPWGDHCITARTDENMADLLKPFAHPADVKKPLMQSLTVDKAFDACMTLYYKFY